MTKEITKVDIIQQIQDKFKLREFETSSFLFSEKVVPTYDIGQHVKQWALHRDRIEITGNGGAYFPDVPQTEQWRIRRITLIHETGANFDITQFAYYATGEISFDYLFYDTTTPIASGTVKIFQLPQDLILSHGMRFFITIANFVAGGYVAMHTLREVETLR